MTDSRKAADLESAGMFMALKFAVSSAAAPIAPPPEAPKAPLGVSEKAAQRIAVILKGETPGAMLRVAVEGGGCSGFQYKFTFDGEAKPDDLKIERAGVTVLVDAVSAPYLAGSELDYVTELIGSSFQIRNPNATASCGCGTSFSV